MPLRDAWGSRRLVRKQEGQGESMGECIWLSLRILSVPQLEMVLPRSLQKKVVVKCRLQIRIYTERPAPETT